MNAETNAPVNPITPPGAVPPDERVLAVRWTCELCGASGVRKTAHLAPEVIPVAVDELHAFRAPLCRGVSRTIAGTASTIAIVPLDDFPPQQGRATREEQVEFTRKRRPLRQLLRDIFAPDGSPLSFERPMGAPPREVER